MRLGKAAPRRDSRTLKLASYLLGALPPTPAKHDLSGYIPGGNWGQMKNDAIGDCTCAAAGHMIMQWTAAAGKLVVPSDADIVAAYSAITGYAPNKPGSDDGAVELDVLNFWRTKGIAGHKIGAYAAVEHRNHDHVRAAVYIFGGLYIGVALPKSAQNQNTWDVPNWLTRWFLDDPTPGSWGGHAVEVVAYDSKGLTVVTWGKLQKMTWAFWDKYVDEAYALLSQDFLNGNGRTPDGFDLWQLTEDLRGVSA